MQKLNEKFEREEEKLTKKFITKHGKPIAKKVKQEMKRIHIEPETVKFIAAKKKKTKFIDPNGSQLHPIHDTINEENKQESSIRQYNQENYNFQKLASGLSKQYSGHMTMFPKDAQYALDLGIGYHKAISGKKKNPDKIMEIEMLVSELLSENP